MDPREINRTTFDHEKFLFRYRFCLDSLGSLWVSLLFQIAIEYMPGTNGKFLKKFYFGPKRLGINPVLHSKIKTYFVMKFPLRIGYLASGSCCVGFQRSRYWPG